MWGYSSTSELFRFPEWWEEILASGLASFGKRFPLGSQFPESPFPDVPGTATEQVRTCGFRRNRQAMTEHPKYETPSDWILLIIFQLPSLRSLQKPRKCFLEPVLNQVCSATESSLYFQVFLSKLLLNFPYSSKLPWYWRKDSVSSEDWIGVLFFNQQW